MKDRGEGKPKERKKKEETWIEKGKEEKRKGSNKNGRWMRAE